MTDKPYVLDASAMLAAFFDEPGAARVAKRMTGALISTIKMTGALISTINWPR